MLIRGQEYEPRAFGDLQLFAIANLISNMNSGIISRQDQHEVGVVLNEVIFDSLPDEFLARDNDGNYVLLLDMLELTALLQDLVELRNQRRGGTEKSREEIELAIAELQAKL
ncbi:MAG: hypothetical protein RLZZ69_3859 [Cyanobacteriota bacterium]